jgi:DNA-binding beta-propeller fold protein YncE
MVINVVDKNEVAVLDTRSRKLIRRFELEGCEGPTGIALDPSAHQIVSACANGVAIVSALDGRKVAALPIGKGADGAAFDPKRRVILIPGGRDGNIAVLRLGTRPSVIANVTTAVSARTIAVDPSSGRAYLPAATLHGAAAGERPKPVPGTFRILVVGP